MLKIVRIAIIMSFVLLVSCRPLSSYDNHEIVALVNDEEITVGDLRLLYADQEALKYIDSLIITELVRQEVAKMDIDPKLIEKEIEAGKFFEKLPPKDTEDEDSKQVRQFAIAQG